MQEERPDTTRGGAGALPGAWEEVTQSQLTLLGLSLRRQQAGSLKGQEAKARSQMSVGEAGLGGAPPDHSLSSLPGRPSPRGGKAAGVYGDGVPDTEREGWRPGSLRVGVRTV